MADATVEKEDVTEADIEAYREKAHGELPAGGDDARLLGGNDE